MRKAPGSCSSLSSSSRMKLFEVARQLICDPVQVLELGDRSRQCAHRVDPLLAKFSLCHVGENANCLATDLGLVVGKRLDDLRRYIHGPIKQCSELGVFDAEGGAGKIQKEQVPADRNVTRSRQVAPQLLMLSLGQGLSFFLVDGGQNRIGGLGLRRYLDLFARAPRNLTNAVFVEQPLKAIRLRRRWL